MIKKNTVVYILFCSVFLLVACNKQHPQTIHLSGEWNFQLDPENVGIQEQWHRSSLNDKIFLPGTTDEARKGKRDTIRHAGMLSRVYPYYGAAWYQYDVEIPAQWKDKHISFIMERSKTTRVWVDDVYIGTQNTLVGLQDYDVSETLTPGKHRITVCVNNAELPPVGDPHQISDQTQTNWNGILGRIELKARDRVWMDDVQVYPDIHQKQMQVKIKFGKKTDMPVDGKITIKAQSWNTDSPVAIASQTYACQPDTAGYIAFNYQVGDKMQLWDEFNPVLYKLNILFEGSDTKEKFSDSKELNIGMRDFTAKGTQFAINGKTIFLRGKNDCGIFPLTGYAPMTVEEWQRLFRIVKSYGLNHYRFHTWCPPEAAFQAADIEGIYMQPELPVWGSLGIAGQKSQDDVEQRIDDDPVTQRIDFSLAEGERIMTHFGNYASFVMMALGNELSGSRDVMGEMVSHLRNYDCRHLYAQGSNNFYNTPALSPGDDYWTTAMTGGTYVAGKFYPDTKEKDVRASYSVYTTGHVNNVLAGTNYDFRNALQGVPVPVIGHETGQYGMYPDFNEIKKYTGVVQARNFEIFKERLQKKGMLEQSDDFFKASGALSVICYREEIETALRTPGFGGFQLLDLQDFSGQGTALVGILDAFMDSKGLIAPEEWRKFCCETVPLIRMPSFVWTSDEKFSAMAEVAHYGPRTIEKADIRWILKNEDNQELVSGNLASMDVPQGGLSQLGEISFGLDQIKTPQKLTLTLSIAKYENDYPIWVFPANEKTEPSESVIVTTSLNRDMLNKVEEGADVLFFPDSSSIRKSVSGTFQSDYWTFVMFKRYKGPGTMGILCDPQHPALAGFPTEFHTNWQWWRLLRHSPVMVLNALPAGFKPVIQVVDHFDRNHKLGVLFEAKLGKGRIVVCSLNLYNNELPEARCLKNSILQHMESKEFNPAYTLTAETFKELFL